VADDEAWDGHLLGGPLDREPVEAVAVNAPLVAPFWRERVGGGLLRDRGVEAGVEDGDLRELGVGALGLLDPPQGWSVVERRERLEREDLGADVGVDQDRLAEPGPAVDDPVRDGTRPAGRRLERLDRLRAPVRRNEVELEAGRPGVDDEDVQ
jgi:hypothetical protein